MFVDAVVYRRWLLSCLAENKCLRSLFVILYDLLPDSPFPDTLQHLTILVCTGIRVAWSELDVCLDKLPSVSSVEILLLDSFYPLVDFVDFCSSTRTWDFEAARDWKEEVIRGMPLLAIRGILSVKQVKERKG